MLMNRLFDGYRGAPPGDANSVEDLLLRLSAMIKDIPQIAERDLNPIKLISQSQGHWVVDARTILK